MEDYCEYQQRLIATFAAPTTEQKLWAVPGLTALLGNTYWGLQLKIKSLYGERRSFEALMLLITILGTERFWNNHASKWWGFMNQAIYIARDLFPYLDKQYNSSLHQLMDLSQHAPQPWQGREVAYCFATISLWSYQEGRTQKAIDKIRAAIHADPKWGYSEYLLGWYGLLLEGIDPISHFVRAIQIDGSLWQNFIHDPLIGHFPEVRVSVERILHQPSN